jgi:hypothetical protein
MKPAVFLITVLALAVLANARVALFPGWVVPVPAVFLAVTLAAVGMFAASIVVRLRLDRVPLPAAARPGAAAEVR